MIVRLTLAALFVVPAAMAYPWQTTADRWLIGAAVAAVRDRRGVVEGVSTAEGDPLRLVARAFHDDDDRAPHCDADRALRKRLEAR